jgi:lipoyl(octanoyl) transferase
VTRDWIVQRLGAVSFEEAQNTQYAFLREASTNQPFRCLLWQPTHTVVTLGRQSTEADQQMALDSGLPVYRLQRGGRLTVHHPGQWILYGVGRLLPQLRQVRWVQQRLLDRGKLLLEGVGVDGVTSRGGVEAGLWTAQGLKIASVGMAVRQWHCWHGVALNLAPLPSNLRSLPLCGLATETYTSVREILGRSEPWELPDTERLQRVLGQHVLDSLPRKECMPRESLTPALWASEDRWV